MTFVDSISHHWPTLPTSGLTISEQSGIEAFPGIVVHANPEVIEDGFLRTKCIDGKSIVDKKISGIYLIGKFTAIGMFRVGCIVSVGVLLAPVMAPVRVVVGELPRVLIRGVWVWQVRRRTFHVDDTCRIAGSFSLIVQHKVKEHNDININSVFLIIVCFFLLYFS